MESVVWLFCLNRIFFLKIVLFIYVFSHRYKRRISLFWCVTLQDSGWWWRIFIYIRNLWLFFFFFLDWAGFFPLLLYPSASTSAESSKLLHAEAPRRLRFHKHPTCLRFLRRWLKEKDSDSSSGSCGAFFCCCCFVFCFFVSFFFFLHMSGQPVTKVWQQSHLSHGRVFKPSVHGSLFFFLFLLLLLKAPRMNEVAPLSSGGPMERQRERERES